MYGEESYKRQEQREVKRDVQREQASHLNRSSSKSTGSLALLAVLEVVLLLSMGLGDALEEGPETGQPADEERAYLKNRQDDRISLLLSTLASQEWECRHPAKPVTYVPHV